MFRIKICGVTRTGDAEHAVQAGCDAIGLNFYPESPRYVSIEHAKELAKAAKDAAAQSSTSDTNSVTIVGVFVNAATDTIQATADAVGLDMIQFHGDESTSKVRGLSGQRRMRALRINDINHPSVEVVAQECRDGQIEAVLVDAYSTKAYGGTGHTVAWDWVPTLQASWPNTPTIVAGGLNPDNVSRAIEISSAHGVDVASGVESAPGVKDPVRVVDFIEKAKAAMRRP